LTSLGTREKGKRSGKRKGRQVKSHHNVAGRAITGEELSRTSDPNCARTRKAILRANRAEGRGEADAKPLSPEMRCGIVQRLREI